MLTEQSPMVLSSTCHCRKCMPQACVLSSLSDSLREEDRDWQTNVKLHEAPGRKESLT